MNAGASKLVNGKGQSVPRSQEPIAQGPHAVRTYNSKLHCYYMRILPGGSYATAAPDEVIVTILGSCVAACIRNPRTGFGGMNHFMLPEHETGEWSGVSASLRYGNYAMEALVNTVLKSGCKRQDLEIKLFGGSNLYDGVSLIGKKNAEFTLKYLEKEGLRVAAHDFGGSRGRRIHYSPATGRVHRLLLRHNVDESVVQAERKYISHLAHSEIEGDIELFD
jgi:chemotaxis protein CheD